jgi:hypothetical protein
MSPSLELNQVGVSPALETIDSPLLLLSLAWFLASIVCLVILQPNQGVRESSTLTEGSSTQ